MSHTSPLNRRILIVDDNSDIHLDFRKILAIAKSNGGVADLERDLFGEAPAATSLAAIEYEIDSAYQGLQGIQMVEKAAAEGRPYALVFMDVRMPPGLDGIETVKRIWQNFPFTEVILCTAYSDYSSEDIIQTLGVSHRLLILKKPFDSVAVKQMALAITSKWNFENEARGETARLEAAVLERTRSLNETVTLLQVANNELDVSLTKNREAQQLLVESSKMSALGVMAGGVAHEINTPLTTLSLNVDMLDETLASATIDIETIREVNEVNRGITARIAKIVGGLRNFCRDGSRDQLAPATVASVIGDAIALCEQRMKNQGVKLELIGVDSNLKINCRPVEISQVVLNLINNAYDAIQGASEKWIRVEVGESAGQVSIAITDSGTGISEAVRVRIFEPFFTTKDVGKGTGLGLSISFGIIQAHGGTLSFDPTSPRTRFVIALPRIAAPRAA